MAQSQGKVKLKLALVYFYDDSTPLFSHTMEGELLARIETSKI